MVDKRIGRRYAQALFTTAQKYDLVRSVEDDLSAIASLLQSDAGFRSFFLAPTTGRDEKLQVAERVFSDRVTALTMQVLRVMLEKRREAELPVVRDEFIAMRREAEGIVFAHVSSATELDATQRELILAKLQAQTGRKFEADFVVDPSLVGGVCVSYDNNVLDGSVKGALSRLREKLRYDLLKQA